MGIGQFQAQAQLDQARKGMGAQQSAPCLHVAKNTLNGGEISPQMSARFDQQRYQTGCEKLLNMVPMPCGGVTRRPGFEFLSGSELVDKEEKNDTATRLIPFIFSDNESRVLEFMSDMDGGCGMRLWFPDGSSLDVVNFPIIDRNILPEMTHAQSADVIYLAHRLMHPMKLCRHADNDWRLEKIQWLPKIPAPAIKNLTWRGTTDSGSRGPLKYVATAIDAQTGEESLPSEPAVHNSMPPLSQVVYAEIEVQPQPNVSEFRIYKRQAGVYGFIGSIPVVDGAETLICEDRNIAPDTEDTPPNGRNPFDGPGNYPAVVFLHQQRLGFASTDSRPMTVWMSQAGNFESMAASVPPNEDDAIEATLAADRANRIIWCASDRSGLAIGTEGGEWNLTNGDGGAATPKQLAFESQTFYGSKRGLPVLRCGSSLIFAQRGGSVIREYGYSFQSDRYESSELSILARHIPANGRGVRSWCWQPEPFALIWLALEDGSLASLTFLRDHEVIAWARHATNGKVEQLCSIPEPGGANWQVWAILMLTAPNGRRYRAVERLRPFYITAAPQDRSPASHLDGPDFETYPSRLIPALPDADLQTGSSFLRVKKINAVKARVMESAPFQVKAIGQGMRDGPIMDIPPRPAAHAANPADWACPLAGGWREFARPELIMDGPDPATILGLSLTLEIAGDSGAQK